MSLSFRKRIKIIPGVHINLSKSGISTSIGVKGASMTFGKSGVYLNTAIPLLVTHNRTKLSGPGLPRITPIYNPEKTLTIEDNIYSTDIREITSQNMQGIKEAIVLAQKQRLDLRKDLSKIQINLKISHLKLVLSYLFIYGLLNRGIQKNLMANIAAQKDTVKQTEGLIENCCVKLNIDFDETVQAKYDKLVEAFKKLTQSHKIWDVTSAQFQDSVSTRSSAGTIVNKRAVRFSFKSIIDIKSDHQALYFENANGADLYFYPSFILMYSNKESFAIIGFDEISLLYSPVRFVETGGVPLDSRTIDYTWAKVNKNGTPDKRFKDNYKIPIVRYGQLQLHTKTGLNEEYQFSNYELMEQFGNAFREYQSTIKHII